MNKINHALKLLTTIASVFLLGYFLESYASTSTLLNDFFEISTELLPLVMSISIFVITWHAYNKNKNNTSLFLGAALLVTGIFDMYHLLSYPFMPDFITPNSQQKAMVFWGGARLISAVLFLASVYIYKDSFSRLINRPVLIVSVNVFNIIFLIVMLAYSDYLPAINYPDGSISTAGILLLLLTSGIILNVGYLFSRRLQETGQKSIVCLIYGFIIIAISNLAHFYNDFSGNLLKAAGYYFIYLALFKLSIEQPYEKRAEADEKRIHTARERYRNLFDNANDAIITTDLEDRITSWNRSAEKIFGWKAEEVIGKNLALMMIPPDLHAERKCLISDIISGKTVSGIETVRLRSDGTSIDVSLTISPIPGTDQNIIGLSSIIRDITERKQAEKLLRQSEEKYRTLIENIQDGVFIIQDTGILFVNEAFARMAGYTVEEVIGRDFQDFIAPEDLTIVKDRYYRRLSGEKNVPKEYEFRMMHRDGARIIVNMNVGLVNYRGRVASMGTVKDITERKKAEEQIKQSLKEKEVLLREIHHRVKNNMQVISSLLRLQAGYIKDKKYLDMFKDSQSRIMTMSLVYEKLYKSEGLAKINFKGYVKDLVNDLFQSYGVKQDAIALNINSDDVSFGVDTAVPCGLIINELVTNSLKYAFPDSRKGEIRISLCKADDEFKLVVGDDGVGIPEEIDFGKTDSLGLHLVKILAEDQLQGEIGLDRSKGTEFKIKFKGGK